MFFQDGRAFRFEASAVNDLNAFQPFTDSFFYEQLKKSACVVDGTSMKVSVF
jgi:hypothetical protein